MRPEVFLLPRALVFWAVYLWAFSPEFRLVRNAANADRAKPASQDARSLQVIIIGMWLGLFAAFPLAFIARFAFPTAARVPALWAGTALLAAGSLLRRHCWRMTPPQPLDFGGRTFRRARARNSCIRVHPCSSVAFSGRAVPSSGSATAAKSASAKPAAMALS